MTIHITRQDINHICNQVKHSQLEKIRTFVMFLGHAHSGHSIIGAILDAHSDVAIANEINVPKLLLDHDLNKVELQKLTLAYTLDNSEWFNTGYKYNIPDSFQGMTNKPVILGDKKGGGSTRVIRNNPKILDKLYGMFGENLKFINVFRKPMDNIAAFSHYWKQPIGMQHVNRYFENLETVLDIESKYPENFYRIDHSSFIKNAEYEITKLLDFLKVSTEKGNIKKWTKIVRKHENKRAYSIKWPKILINEINLKNIEFKLTDSSYGLRFKK